MARKPATRSEFALFDVFYEDGSQRSPSPMGALVLTRHFKKYSSKFQRLNELL